MESKKLPDQPNLEQYRKQAKDLVKSCKSGNADAFQRISKYYPRFQNFSDFQKANFALADAQLVIAREHGFESWPKFVRHIESLINKGDSRQVWKDTERTLITGDADALGRLLREHSELLRNERPPAYGPGGLAPEYSGDDVRSIIIKNHHFETWETFEQFQELTRGKDSPVAHFESAVDAVIEGDVATLEQLLRMRPDLIRARSLRKHHSTLLHYIGANGIEDFRQRTPKNAVAIAKVLLSAGADVNAPAEMYGGRCTTLSLVATSIHPVIAGVLIPLMEVLLNAGAIFNDSNGGSLVTACLANGRPQAADFLAKQGARLDLEGAAGVGRLDVVRSFFNKDGSLKENATREQMKDAFAWACEFGQTSVVAFLIDRGVDVRTQLKHHGQTGLHWAAYGAHTDTVKLLLDRKAVVDAKDATWHNTPLSWALYAWNNPPPEIPRERYWRVVFMLVAAGATIDPEWLTDKKILADSLMRSALAGKTDFL